MELFMMNNIQGSLCKEDKTLQYDIFVLIESFRLSALILSLFSHS